MNSVVKRYLAGGIIALASGVLIGCLPEDDFQDIEVMAPSPKVSLPLLNTNLTLSNLINTDKTGSVLIENQDKSYSLLYKTGIASPPVEEFFPAIPEQHYAKSYALVKQDLSPINDILIFGPIQDEIPLDLNDLTLYKIESKKGFLNLTLHSTYQHNIEAKISFPGIKDKQGQTLILVYDLQPWKGSSSTQSISLEDYDINISNSKLNYGMEVTIASSVTGKPISATDEIRFEFSMADIAFSYLEGNFSNITIPVDADTMHIPILANAVQGNIALNPKLKLNFSNSFGVNIVPDLSNVYVKRQSGSVVKLMDEGNSNFFSGLFEIPYPRDRKEAAATKLQMVADNNSNIEEAFAEIPREVNYNFGFAMSSGESDTSFVASNSRIGVDMQVELPLEGSFDITLEDTMAVDFNDLSENLEELKVLIKTENSFPINANLQIYFLDKYGEMIKDEHGEPITLFEEGTKFMKAATIINTQTGETKALSTDMPLAATINNSKYNLLKDTKNFLVRTEMNSSSEQDNKVKLYSFYNIRFSMAMQIKASL